MSNPQSLLTDGDQSYTCLIDHEITRHDGKVIMARKKSCRTVWCPICFRRFRTKKLVERLREMDWKCVRHVILTIDRRADTEFFVLGAEETFNFIRGKRGVSEFVHDLKRTHDKTIIDYAWFLEWHGDGFPHWHVFIQVDKQGRLGMLNGEALRKAWKFGGVRETYVKDKNHWDKLTGYFQKAGYFEKGKSHQGILPEWALNYKNIRRYDSMRKEKTETEIENGKKLNLRRREIQLNKMSREIEREARNVDIESINDERDIYEIVLSRCGSMTEITILDFGIPIAGKMIPNTFNEMKDFITSNGGSYSKEYGGYILKLSELEFNLFCAIYL
jgi:hypothetical protein